VPAALADAVFDATGVRPRSVPLTAAKLKALLA
jgi:CO/xanthine dehydrogenase Mo-binding subunit